jgi:hypothetical protein
VIITGLPRSGTTLTCELLNRLDDTVALDEPMSRDVFTARPVPARRGLTARVRGRISRQPSGGRTQPPPRSDVTADDICDNIEAFALSMRESLLSKRTAVSTQVEGQVRGTKVADGRQETGLRVRLARRSEIVVDKDLSPTFLLAMKHNSAFAGVLDRLVLRMPVYAIVRNPLSILSSWQTVPFAVQRGHATLAELFHPPLAEALAAIPDRLDRQFHLLAWFFGRFVEYLPARAVVRYEDIVASGGTALEVVSARAARLRAPLISRNAAGVYDPEQVRRIGERLLDTDGPWWQLYSRDDVHELLHSFD